MICFEEYVLNKIDTGEELSEEELKEIIYTFKTVDKIYDDELNRWTRNVTSILRIGNRFFSLDWEEGLTERQEDFFYSQPIEVEKKERTITVITTEWIEIEKRKNNNE